MFQRRNVPFVAILGLLPVVLAACSDATSSTDPRTQPPLVRVGTVEISGESERSFTGIVAARVQSDLGFRVPGKVLERLVDAGQTVKRGQALMRIDPTDLRLAMRAQEEAVAAARARARQAADDEVRYRRLVSANFVSASAYDKVKAAAEAAKAELNAAEAQADVARNETSYAVLLADADGVVVETLAEPGQVVSCWPGRRACGACRAPRGGHRASRNPAPGDRIHRPGHLIWKRADGPCETSAVVGRRKPSESDVRGSVRVGGSSGRGAARLDHLHAHLGWPVRPGAAGTVRRDFRSGQRPRRMAGRREAASSRVACRADLGPERRSCFGRRRL